MKVFVTGANGYLGREIVDLLLAEGHHVGADMPAYMRCVCFSSQAYDLRTSAIHRSRLHMSLQRVATRVRCIAWQLVKSGARRKRQICESEELSRSSAVSRTLLPWQRLHQLVTSENLSALGSSPCLRCSHIFSANKNVLLMQPMPSSTQPSTTTGPLTWTL